MKPVDPRLLARVGATRRLIGLIGLMGAAVAFTVLAQALILARVLAPALAPSELTTDGLGAVGRLVPQSLRDPQAGIVALAAVIALRVVLTALQERLAHRAGARTITELRQRVVEHTATLGPRWVASGAGASVATLVTRGLEALMPYFTKYLPALVTAATVTPLAIVLVAGLDGLSGLIVVLTLPLVPAFMILIGLLTRDASARHLDAMRRLSARTLDLIAGLPTLRGLGRAAGPADRIRELGEAHRKATMGSLRVAFLSGMVLELLTTLSVAIVAVSMGFRLAAGDVSIETALAVLILAPEAYLPLRNVGGHFHSSADGLAAADEAFAVLDETAQAMPEAPGAAPCLDLTGTGIALAALSVATPHGDRDAPSELSVTAFPGKITVLIGPNGEGKSTALMALAGLLPPTGGAVMAGEFTLSDTRGSHCLGDSWSSQVAWVPQRPDLGPAGARLSLGQRQRVALERAFSSDRPVLLLDEPTAHLDAAARAEVIEHATRAARAGRTVVVATHDPLMVAAADATIHVGAKQVAR